MKALSRTGKLKGMWGCGAAVVAALALTVAPAGAQAASPILEFASPGGSVQIPFATEGTNINARLNNFNYLVDCASSTGSGEITGPQTTVSSYVFRGCLAQVIEGPPNDLECTSEGAAPMEIRSKTIEADLVYLNQANHEVAMLLNPSEGVYMEFECGTNPIKASGSFLAPVDPVNQLAGSFTTVVKSNDTSQNIKEYEDLNGEKHKATPMGQVGSETPAGNGIALEMTIKPTVPLEIKAISREEVEAKQRAEEEAAAKRKQEEDAAKAAEAKKRQEEADAKAAAERKLQEEAKKHEEERRQKAQAKKRAQHRAKALRHCRQLKSPQKRTRCETRVKKKFSAPKAHSMRVSRF